jgi:predicted deacylase
LRYAASKAGVPSVTLEAGGPSQLELEEVKHGVKGIETLLTTLGMVRKLRFWGEPEPIYYRSSWVRASRGGILLADVSLGSTVRKGDVLGSITDPMNNAMTEIISPYEGRVIGMARNQVVMPGFATFHIGIQTDEPSVPASNDFEIDIDGEEGSGTSISDEDDEPDQIMESPQAGDDEYIDGTVE